MSKPTKEKLLETAVILMEEDSDGGICHACGATAYGVEPDAKQYACEACGENQVYGAEETLIMLA